MARLTDGNFYPQKVVIDYPAHRLTLRVSKEEVDLRKAVVVEPPSRIIKFDNPRKKLFIILVLIVLALFIYSNLLVLNEAVITNLLLSVLWLSVGGAIIRYYLKAEYRLTLRDEAGIYILKLDERETTAFNTYVLERERINEDLS